LALLIAISLQS